MEPIIAPVTALINQPVGILRLTGDDLENRLRSFFPELPSPLEHRKVYRVIPTFEGIPLDECLLLFFKAPHSFTGEDVIEIHAHGNPHNIRKFLSIFHQNGIRAAKPGEFSLRAYQNHKITLLKAESFHRMISAPSYAHFQSAHQHFSDPSSHPLLEIQDRFLDTLSLLFTLLDHPDADEEDRSSLSHDNLLSQLQQLNTLLRTHIHLYRKRHRPFNGYSVLLAGHPNSGKSSLFNRILKDNRAIVSPIPGTTRDLLEGRLSFSFGDIVLLDSAGLRNSHDQLEREGIRKTRQTFSQVDCILWISSPEHPVAFDSLRPHQSRGSFLTVWNKADIEMPPLSMNYDHIVSAHTRKGISKILTRLRALAETFYLSSDPLSSSLESDRQLAILRSLRAIIKETIMRIEMHQYDFALSCLEEGKKVLDDGVGAVPSSEIYDRVFKHFCLGK